MGVALRQQIRQLAFTAALASDNTIIPGVTGKIITVIGIILNGSAANTVIFKDGTGGTPLSGAMVVGVATMLVLPVDPTVDWYQSAVAGNNFVLTLSTTAAVTGTVWYVQN